MNPTFNRELLNQDVQAVREFLVKFLKSFGPSQKKISGRVVPMGEQMQIRFRLMLVEAGISHVIRVSLAIIVGLIAIIVFFSSEGIIWRIIIGGSYGYFLFKMFTGNKKK